MVKHVNQNQSDPESAVGTKSAETEVVVYLKLFVTGDKLSQTAEN
mgnify:CR=1 FL=1